MADDIVMLTQQFTFFKTADLDEIGVHIGDITVEIGGGQYVGCLTEGYVVTGKFKRMVKFSGAS